MVRYRGGTSFALDAAMHGSGNLLFVAAVPPCACTDVEDTLIFEHRIVCTYNNVGKKKSPSRTLEIVHVGDPPRFVARLQRA